MKIYRNGIEIFEVKEFKQTGRFMEIATIDCTVKSPTPFIFKVGDYVVYDYNGLKYSLYGVNPEKKQSRSNTYGEAFIYDLTFKADTEQLDICPFLDLVLNDNNTVYTSLPSFSTFENVYGIAARIQANMDSMYPSQWRIEVAETDDEALLEELNEAKEFSISGESCLGGLKKIYDTWGVSYIHSYEDGVNVITIGKSAGVTSVFKYGKGQGLRTIKKNIQNADQLCTRAFVFGSTRNLPARWYNDKGYISDTQYAPNLMIPPSKWVNGEPKGAYIDAIFDKKMGDQILVDVDNRIEKYGLKIKTLRYDGSDSSKDEIFPSIEKVTAGNIRSAKEELGQTDNIPSSIYPDNERMDYILEGTSIEDDGIGTESGYTLYSEKVSATSKSLSETITIAEEKSEEKYNLVSTQKTINLCTFDIAKAARYRISEINDFVTFQKNDLDSNITATLYLQRPSGDYIQLKSLSFSDSLKASLELPESITPLNEVGVYTLVLKISVNWNTDTVIPQVGSDVYLSYNSQSQNVVLARGENILSDFFTIKVKQIGFDINDVTASDGSYKTILLKSGMCSGRVFTITQSKYSSEDDGWVFTCKRQEDSSLSQRFPNNIFPISTGDQFVLLNINMPDLYVHTAMQRLYDTAIEDLRYLSKQQFVVEPEIDNLQMARSPQIIKEGMYMPIEDADISIDEDILIDSVVITDKEKQLRTFEVTLRNDKIYNRFNKIASRISDLENSLQSVENANTVKDVETEIKTETFTPSVGLDENALAEYLKENKYTTEDDVADVIKKYWYIDEQGNLHTNYTIVAEGDVVSGGSPDGEGGEDGEGSGSGSTVVVTPILTEGEHIATIQVDGVPQKIYAPKTTEVDLSGYATEDYVDSAIQNAKDTRVDTLINTTIPALESDIAKRALQSSLDSTNSNVSNLQSAHNTLRSEFDALSAVLNDDVSGKINTWNEVVDFLDEYSGSQDLATILSAMNADIAKRALQTSLDTTNANLTALTTRVTTAENSITSVSNKVKAFEDIIGIDSSGNVYIKKKSDGTARNFYAYGDIISGGEGDGSSSGSGGGGSTVSWANSYTSTNGLKIATISIDGVDTPVYTAKNLSAYTNDSGYITSAALSGYATQDWVTAKGYLTSVSWSAVTGKPTFATVATSGKYSDLSGTPTIPTSLKSPYALTFGSKTYDGSAAKTILASDLGALTAHQTIYALTIKNSAGTTQTTYTPNSAAASITLTKAMVGLGNVENTALSTWAGSSKITTLGTITSGVWNGTAITNAYINSVDWSKITSKPTTLSGYGITDSLYFQETIAEYAPARFLSSAMATKAATKYIEWWQSGAGWFNHLSGKYIVNGGTSSQFLKADGSLDSTAYIHSGNIGDYAFVPRTQITSNTDANTLLTNGAYLNATGNGSGNSNFPNTYSILMTFAQSSSYAAQFAIGNGSAYVRRKIDTWSDWKTIAFTDSNVASATKLQTARTIWGQSFDGTGNVNGNFTILAGYGYTLTCNSVQIPSNGDRITFNSLTGTYTKGVLVMNTGNTYIEAPLSSDSSSAAQPPILIGWRNGVYPFYISSSGNILIGTTTDAGFKLYVAGNFAATGEVTSGSDARYKSILSHASIDLETIANAPIINFKWTDREDDKVHLGSTAQYWYGTSLCNGVIPTNDEKLWTMGYGQIALASVVSVAKKVVNHEERLQIVEKELADYKAENQMLKQQLEQYRRA